MSFLLGAYGKLAAGKRLRSLQYRLTQVMQKAQRATRDMAEMEKMLNRQEQAMNRNISMQTNMMNGSMQSSIFAGLMNQFGGANGQIDFEGMSQEQKTAYQLAQTQMSMQMSQQQSFIQMQTAQAQQYMQQELEMAREMMLKPLQDLSDSLETEKASLDTQVKLAENDYNSMKEMEKSGAKDYVPEYTGQG